MKDEEPKQESPEEPTMITDWLNEYGDPEIYKKVERELESREAARKYTEPKQKFMYVATWDGIPVLGAPNRELLEQALNEYNNDTPIRYEAYNPKYPDDLEGWYYYKDPQSEGEEIRFSVRCIEFKGE